MSTTWTQWTKVTMNLLAVALLLATASAVAAAETDAPSDLDVPQQSQVPGCDTEGAALLALEGMDPIPAGTQYCGSCSTGGCAGAERGQICWLGGGRWGHCNIFSGGYMCTEGGWECQCEGGVLP